MKKLLLPFTWVYSVAVYVDRALTRPRRLSAPVISVGNITWGGTGKTPAVIALARHLAAHGKKAAVLTRGYRRKSTGSIVVSDGTGMLAGPEQAGDEPSLIARECPQAVVMAGADRFAAGIEAQNRFHPAVFILDDGFQHWGLTRDLDIVCVNAADPFGNGCLIPAGSLREMPSAVGRAHLILLTNADRVDEARRSQVAQEISRCTTAPVCQTAYAVAGVRRILDGASLPADQLRDRPVTVVSALGNNAGFEQSVAALGCRIVGRKTFRDHHWYTADELARMRADGDALFITSAKDAVKLKTLLSAMPLDFAERWYETESDMTFMAGEDIWREKLKPFL